LELNAENRTNKAFWISAQAYLIPQTTIDSPLETYAGRLRETIVNGQVAYRRATVVALVVAASGLLFGASLAETPSSSSNITTPQTPSPATCKNFLVFDGTMYRNKPDLLAYGVQPINITYAGKFWPSGPPGDQLPDHNVIREIALSAAARGQPVVLDIEHWRLNTEAQSLENLPKYIAVLNRFRSHASGLRVGYFGMLPLPDYGRGSMALGFLRYKAWQSENDRLKPLAAVVDAMFPEAYTLFPDREGWTKFATAMISEAKRYGKPVYLFLWPQYSERNKLLGYHYLPDDYWQLQLETARQYADGIVIWGGWDPSKRDVADWNDQASWWRITKQFMEKLNTDKLKCQPITK
jgi:hypothetical protein